MANKHRNECVIKVGGKNFKVRATLELLEEYEEHFATTKLKATVWYRLLGWILSKSDQQISDADGAQLAFNELGLEATQEAVNQFLSVAYKTGEKETEEKKDLAGE